MMQNRSIYDGKGQLLDLLQDDTCLSRHILTNGLLNKYSLKKLEQRLPFDHLALQVARDLDYQGLLTKGSSLSFDVYVTHASPQSNVDALIKQGQTLFKIIDKTNWSDFVKQITDYSYRPKLRTTRQSVKTHKFVHNTQEIIPYNPVKKVKVPHQHTKKQSTTLLSPNLNTEYFGQRSGKPAVGFLFNRNQCVIKGMFKHMIVTFERQWVGTEVQVREYYICMFASSNLVVNEKSFLEHVRSSFKINEVLAKLSKEAILGIWVASATMDAKKIAIERQQELFKLFGVKHPIYLYDNRQKKVVLYTAFMQYQDIFNLSLNEFSLYNAFSQGDFANLANSTGGFITKLLKLAIKDNNRKLIEEFLIRLDPQYLNSQANILLAWAAQNGHAEMITKLLDNGAEVDVKDDSGKTALIWAAQNGHVDVLELLLNRSANIESHDINHSTALHWAAYSGHIKVVEYLLEKGALLEAKGAGSRTALIFAAERGHTEVVKGLLEKGANIESSDINHSTALHYAAYNGHVDVLELLLNRGANIEAHDINQGTALHCAAYNGHIDVLELLLQKNASVNARDRRLQKNALDTAIERHPKLIKPLLMHIASLPMVEQAACLAEVAGGPYENVLTYAAIEMPSLFDDLLSLGPVRNKVNLDHGQYDEHFKNIRDHYMNMREKSLDNSSYIDASDAAGELLRTCVQAKIDLIQCENMSAETITKFKDTCISAIEKARPILHKHREWGKVLAAFLLAIITFPVSIPLFAMGFFSIKTKSEQLLDKLQEASIQSMPG